MEIRLNKLKKTIFSENPDIKIFEYDEEASPSLHKHKSADDQKMLGDEVYEKIIRSIVNSFRKMK